MKSRPTRRPFDGSATDGRPIRLECVNTSYSTKIDSLGHRSRGSFRGEAILFLYRRSAAAMTNLT